MPKLDFFPSSSSSPAIDGTSPPSWQTETSSLLPLAVDLDGTLVATDTLVECLLVLLKHNPLLLFAALGWLLRGGKARLKREVTRRVMLDVSVLPYHAEFIRFLRAEKARGRHLALVTAADRAMAECVAAPLAPLFNEILASTENENLAGKAKAARLTEHFGPRGFAYAGNSEVDRAVWAEAGEILLVNASPALKRNVEREHGTTVVFEPTTPGGWRTWLRALRPHQWMKNALLIVPFLAAHHWHSAAGWTLMALAFCAFSLCASSVYITNDLLDLEADRHHPRKRHRPFASGALPLLHGGAMASVLLALGLGLAVLVSPEFFGMTLIYYITTLAYSLWLKRAEIIDVLVLAGLYTIRLVAGGAAVHVPLSAWLLAFSMFMFLSLALVKRFNELLALKKQDLSAIRGRGYRVSDLGPVASMGVASGCVAVLVLALYVNSADVLQLYRRPMVLWALCPMVFYWISYVWLLTHRDELHEDPVVFALRDVRSYLLGALGILVLFLALPR